MITILINQDHGADHQAGVGQVPWCPRSPTQLGAAGNRGSSKDPKQVFWFQQCSVLHISRSFPRTFEAPHLKDEAVRKVQSKNRVVKLVGVVFVLLLVVHLAIFVWEEVKLPGSTGSLLTEPFWYLWDVFL